LNLLLAFFTLLGYAAPYFNPSTFWILSFFGLALPYFLISNIIFLIIWIFRRNAKLLLSLIILILGYKSIPGFIQLRVNSETPTQENEIKVLSFNVRVFDLYMWTKEKTTRNQILKFLKEEDPDILCLQEFYHTDKQHPDYEFKTLDTLISILSAKNYHVHYTTNLRETDHWGVITFSKYPILNKGVVPFAIKDDNICTYTDINKNGRTLRVFNAHLASIKLDKHDYKAMQEVNKNEYSEDFGKELAVLSKIKYGFIRRSGQADSIRSIINETPYPVILCGDFNDTPSSYAYRTIKGALNDAFVSSGSGLGRTYIGEFPSFRIDYIFYDPELKATNFTTHSEKLSDHHPISVNLALE